MNLPNALLYSTILATVCSGALVPHGLRKQRILQDGDEPFYRYQVIFQGGTGETNCPRPTPTIDITSSSNTVEFVEASEGVECRPEGQRLVCTGEGTATFNVYPDNGGCAFCGLFGEITGIFLSATMRTPQDEFICNPVTSDGVSQAFTMGQLCPNGSKNFVLETCLPDVSKYRVFDGVPLCVSSCNSATCTEQDLVETRTEVVVGGCEWESNGPPAVVPTAAPAANPQTTAPTTNESITSPTVSPLTSSPTGSPVVGPQTTAPTQEPVVDSQTSAPTNTLVEDPTKMPTSGALPTSMLVLQFILAGLFGTLYIG